MQLALNPLSPKALGQTAGISAITPTPIYMHQALLKKHRARFGRFLMRNPNFEYSYSFLVPGKNLGKS